MKKMPVAIFAILLFCIGCTNSPSENTAHIPNLETQNALLTYMPSPRLTELARLEAEKKDVSARVTQIQATQAALKTQVAYATPDSTTYFWAASQTPISVVPLGGSTQPPTVSIQTPRSTKLVGIVVGHLGKDMGNVCSDALGGTREVDVNQNIANLVKDNLTAAGNDVDLLTEFDPRLNGYNALALVSIHAGSCEYINDQATGFKVTAAGLDKNSEQSMELTTCLQEEYGRITGLNFLPGVVTADMTTYHDYHEIYAGTPVAVIEVGYLNLDHQLLTQNPELLAKGISEGILCYVSNGNK